MRLPLSSFVVGLTLFSTLGGCSESSTDPPSSGGASNAGTSSGGTAAGGASSGGLGGGGASGGSAGLGTGGKATGGVSTGGLGTGGAATGGKASGGVSTGGLGTGGGATGGGGLGSGGTTGGALSGGSGGSTTCSAGFANVGGIGSGTGDNPAPTFDTLKAVIESTNVGCNGADCHFGSKTNALELKIDAGLHMRLLNTVSTKCMNLPVVTPCKPDQSALVRLLKGTCGTAPRMPYDCDEALDECVPIDYITAIEQWVANGAPP